MLPTTTGWVRRFLSLQSKGTKATLLEGQLWLVRCTNPACFWGNLVQPHSPGTICGRCKRPLRDAVRITIDTAAVPEVRSPAGHDPASPKGADV